MSHSYIQQFLLEKQWMPLSPEPITEIKLCKSSGRGKIWGISRHTPGLPRLGRSRIDLTITFYSLNSYGSRRHTPRWEAGQSKTVLLSWIVSSFFVGWCFCWFCFCSLDIFLGLFSVLFLGVFLFCFLVVLLVFVGFLFVFGVVGGSWLFGCFLVWFVFWFVCCCWLIGWLVGCFLLVSLFSGGLFVFRGFVCF